jgi:hypothetical protein
VRAGDIQFPVRQLDFSTRSGHGGKNIITAVHRWAEAMEIRAKKQAHSKKCRFIYPSKV